MIAEAQSVEQTTSGAGLDPVVRAMAEARAKETGQSLDDYIAQLVFAQNQDTSVLDAYLLKASTSTDPKLADDLWFGAMRESFRSRFRHLYLGSNEDRLRGLVMGHEPWLASELSLSPTLHLVAIFNFRVHSASLLMSAAFHEAAVTDFKLPAPRQRSGHRRVTTWYGRIVADCLDRSREVRNALVHHWQPTPRAERLATDAFVELTDLTPARTELLQLCRYDRPRAFLELARHLELITDQFELSANLLAEVEGVDQPRPAGAEKHFSNVSAKLLENAGGGLSLTDAATLVATTRQALHKRVKLGSALGMMQGDELVLPRIQFVSKGDKTSVVDGLAPVVKLFDTTKAGRWSALQFLVERDPNLGDTPIHALTTGRKDDVASAASAYLGVGEA